MTALGTLPTNQPLKVGSAQRKNGAAEATAVLVGNYCLVDGAGNQMRVLVAPTRPCVWVVQANFIYNHNDIAWTRFDAGIILYNQTDQRGVSVGHRGASSQYSFWQWSSFSSSAMFYLAANVTYAAYLWCFISDNQTIYHQAARHLNMFGYTLGENYR